MPVEYIDDDALKERNEISIRIRGSITVGYKSIKDLDWQKIPMLSVLTGLNGSGKSQLLKLLAFSMTGTQLTDGQTSVNTPIEIHGDTFSPDQVAYMPAENQPMQLNPVGLHDLYATKVNLQETLRHFNYGGGDWRLLARKAHIERILGPDVWSLPAHEFQNRLPEDLSFMLDHIGVLSGLSYFFQAYRSRKAKMNEVGEDESLLGPAPWTVLDQILNAAGFPYHIKSPLGTDFHAPYRPALIDSSTGRELEAADLSSGEQTIFEMALWLFKNQIHASGMPKIYLLDEPDAHLHPMMTRQFLDVIQEVFVKRHNIRVIIATHSPSTVALAPSGAIFELARNSSTVRNVQKAEVLGKLSGGLVIVAEGTRFVLVEDSDDVSFYNMLSEILAPRAIEDGKCVALAAAPSIVFLPASVGKGEDKKGGGCTVIRQWVEKFSAPPLNEILRGIVDGDKGSVPVNRVYVLTRYSIENFLLDPIVVFAALSEHGLAPLVDGAPARGEEHELRNSQASTLQPIVDLLLNLVESATEEYQKNNEKIAVVFTNGVQLFYPRWLLETQGHALMQAFRQTFGQHNVTAAKLMSAYRRVRMVPVDLVGILLQIQGSQI